jgi:hypothetical protein
MDISTGVVRTIFIGVVALGAMGLGFFIKRYFNIVLTWWGGIFCFLSLGSFIVQIIDEFKQPENDDIFFVVYGLVMGVLGLISILRNNPRLRWW